MEKQALWKEHGESAHLGASLLVSRLASQKLAQAVVDAALRVPAATLPAWTGVDLGDQGYAVIEVTKVIPFSAESTSTSAKSAPNQKDALIQATSAAENLAYYNFLKSSYKVKINVPSPQSGVAVGLR